MLSSTIQMLYNNIDIDFFEENDGEQPQLDENVIIHLDHGWLREITQALSLNFPPRTEINCLIRRIAHLINRLKRTHEAQSLNSIAQALSTDSELIWCMLVIVKSSDASLSDTSLIDKIKWCLSSVNAMTILNYARFNFSGRNLRGIGVPGADLTKALLHYTDLSDSDLSETNLSHAYLANANLTGANLRGCYFGQEPYLSVPDKERLCGCVCSPCGQWIAGYNNLHVYLWSTQTNALEHKIVNMLEGEAVKKLSFRPDGEQLAVLGFFSFFMIETSSGKILRNERSNSGEGEDIAWYEDHCWVAYTQSNSPRDPQRITVYDWGASKAVHEFSDYDLYALRLSVFQNTVWLRGIREKQLLLWNLLKPSEKPVWQLQGDYVGYYFSADGQWLAARKIGVIAIWEVGMQRCINTFLLNKEITCLALSSGAQLLALGSKDGTLQVWDIQANRRSALFQAEVDSLHFNPHSTSLVSLRNSEGVIRQWPLRRLQSVLLLPLALAPVPALKGRLIAVNFSTNEKQAWLSYEGGKPVITCHQSKQPAVTISLPARNTDRLWLESIGCFSLAGNLYAHVGPTGNELERRDVSIWDLGREPASRVALFNVGQHVDVIALSVDGSLLALGGSVKHKKIIHLWHTSDKQLKSTFILKGLKGSFGDLIFSPQEENLIFALNNDVWVGSWRNKKYHLLTVPSLNSSSNAGVIHLSINKDSQHLIVTRTDGMIEYWDLATEKMVFMLKGQPGTYCNKSFSGLGSDEQELVNINEGGVRMSWRKQQGECFILSSDIPLKLGFYGDGVQLKGATDDHLSDKDKLFLQQQGAMGLEEREPLIDKLSELTSSLENLSLEKPATNSLTEPRSTGWLNWFSIQSTDNNSQEFIEEQSSHYWPCAIL